MNWSQPGGKPVTVDNPLAVVSEDGQFSIGNKDMTVYIPASQSVKAGKTPAPVLSVQKGDRKIGNNRLYAHHKNVERIETLPVEVGELVCEISDEVLSGRKRYVYCMDKGGTRISVCHIGRRDERIIKRRPGISGYVLGQFLLRSNASVHNGTACSTRLHNG